MTESRPWGNVDASYWSNSRADTPLEKRIGALGFNWKQFTKWISYSVFFIRLHFKYIWHLVCFENGACAPHSGSGILRQFKYLFCMPNNARFVSWRAGLIKRQVWWYYWCIHCSWPRIVVWLHPGMVAGTPQYQRSHRLLRGHEKGEDRKE